MSVDDRKEINEVREFLDLKKELKVNRYKQTVTLCFIVTAIILYFFAPQSAFTVLGLSFFSLAETIFPSREQQAIQYIRRLINSDPKKLALLAEKTKYR